MIIGLIVLAALGVAVILVLLSENDTPETGATPTASAADLPSASAVATTTSPAASATDAAPTGLQVGTFVAPTVDGVTLRDAPTTAGTRVGELPRGEANLVIEGPTEADGYSWYRLSAIGLPPSSGCVSPLPTDPLQCPIWYGWAASGEPADEESWFEPIEVECPDPDQDPAGFFELSRRVPLGCYGSSPITFIGWYPAPPEGGLGGSCEADPAVEWLYCTGSDGAWTSPDEARAFVSLHIDPDSGVVLPEPDEWLRVTGAYDHPDAPTCAAAADAAGDPDPDLAVLECRAQFVVHGVEVTPAP